MVSDKTKFKRLVFTLVTLSLAILIAMASVGVLSWFAGLPDWGKNNELARDRDLAGWFCNRAICVASQTIAASFRKTFASL
jgi:hypothetical protein